MADLKTKKTNASVGQFMRGVEDPQRRKDCRTVLEMMKDVTGERPKLWGDSIVGFGSYHYKYASGREGDWFVVGFSPRKASLSVYIMAGLSSYRKLLAKLGKHKTGKSCLYIKRLEDIDLGVLRQLVEESVAQVRSSQRA